MEYEDCIGCGRTIPAATSPDYTNMGHWCERCGGSAKVVEREPTDDEIYNRPTIDNNEPGSLGENDWRL